MGEKTTTDREPTNDERGDDPLLTQWARLLLESLAAAGVEHAVISPGSRSTPFAYAALECAAVECESVIDERSAAFIAVGRAKVTNKPSLLICTSGSAAANYFPAIVEASSSNTPLVVLTADRPFELSHCSAPQTIDQVKLYGRYVRHFADLGNPDPSPAALIALRRSAAQAVALSCGEPPGPVHLNARAKKPLEPVTGAARTGPLEAFVNEQLARPLTRATRPERRPSDALIRAVAEDCRNATSGIVVAGPSAIYGAPSERAVSELLRRTGFSFYAEATSQLRWPAPAPSSASVDALDLLLRSREVFDALRFDVAIQLGAPPVSGQWEAFVRRGRVRALHVVSDHGWPDPIGTAASIALGDLEASIEALTNALPNASELRRVPWLAPASALAFRAVAAECDRDKPLSEGQAVRAVLASAPDGALLAVGNSLPVREIDLYWPSGDRRLSVWSQRGASGIDGVLSGALGAARAWTGPTVLLLGDVSLLHDIGALLSVRTIDKPFVVVALNNDGGRIFDQLPIARAGAAFEHHLDFWRTPHGMTFERAAAGYGIAYENPPSAAELTTALARAYERKAATLVEVTLRAGDERAELDRIVGEVRARVVPLLSGR